jgi:uncharacterized membrane protein YhaH (DUF805 family)
MHGLIRFAFPRKIGRLEYFIRLLVCGLMVGYLIAFHDATEPRIALTVFVIWHFGVFFVLWPRLRDCGMPGMWVILSLMPVIFVFLSIALIFRAPEFRFEESGDNPPQTT